MGTSFSVENYCLYFIFHLFFDDQFSSNSQSWSSETAQKNVRWTNFYFQNMWWQTWYFRWIRKLDNTFWEFLYTSNTNHTLNWIYPSVLFSKCFTMKAMGVLNFFLIFDLHDCQLILVVVVQFYSFSLILNCKWTLRTDQVDHKHEISISKDGSMYICLRSLIFIGA